MVFIKMFWIHGKAYFKNVFFNCSFEYNSTQNHNLLTPHLLCRNNNKIIIHHLINALLYL